MIRRLVFLFLLTGCPQPPRPVPPPGAATCADVCKRYEALGCAAAKPTPKGTPCAEVCENLQSSGVLKFNLECRVRAATCEAADRCE